METFTGIGIPRHHTIGQACLVQIEENHKNRWIRVIEWFAVPGYSRYDLLDAGVARGLLTEDAWWSDDDEDILDGDGRSFDFIYKIEED